MAKYEIWEAGEGNTAPSVVITDNKVVLVNPLKEDGTGGEMVALVRAEFSNSSFQTKAANINGQKILLDEVLSGEETPMPGA